jgi:hypothetical protein
MIFAREVSDSLTSLVKKIDAETAKNSKAKMGSFVVYISDDEKLGDKLKSIASKEGIKSTVLTIMDNPTGPPKYEVAKDAAVTVVFYNQRKVLANHAFKAGEFNSAAVDKVMADLPKILETKKKKAE